MKKTIAGLLITSVAGAALLALPVSAQQGRFASVTISTTDLGGGVYMLSGAGGNMGLSVGEDGAFLIDDQFAPLSEKIKAAIAEVSETPVKFLINTHWHGDHTGGNESFGHDGTTIIAHHNVRTRLSTDQVMEAFGREVKAAPEAAWPVITFNDEVNFYQNGQEIEVFHVATAHTDGDALIYFRTADVLHMGDVFFHGSYPFIDTGSGGSIDGVIAAHEEALALAGENTKIIPGHGPMATRADLAATLAMIKSVRAKVAQTIADGLTLEQAIAADPLAEFNEQWGKGFIKPESMLRIVYGDLSSE